MTENQPYTNRALLAGIAPGDIPAHIVNLQAISAAYHPEGRNDLREATHLHLLKAHTTGRVTADILHAIDETGLPASRILNHYLGQDAARALLPAGKVQAIDLEHAFAQHVARRSGTLTASTRQAAEHFGLSDDVAATWFEQQLAEAKGAPADPRRDRWEAHPLTLAQHLDLWASQGRAITLPLGRRVHTTTKTGRPSEHRLEWLNANRGQHWGDSSPQVRSWRQAAANEAALHHLPTGLDYVTIDAYIHKHARRMYDPANLAPTAKAIVDGLVEQYGLLPNDNLQHLDGPHLHHAGFGSQLDTITVVITPCARPEHIDPPSATS